MAKRRNDDNDKGASCPSEIRAEAYRSLSARARSELRAKSTPGARIGMAEARAVAGTEAGAALILGLAWAGYCPDGAKVQAMAESLKPKGVGV